MTIIIMRKEKGLKNNLIQIELSEKTNIRN